MQTIYRRGQWYLIVIPGALVALPPDVPGDIVARLWDRLPLEKTLAGVVDVLTTGSGGSFTSLPPFAAAVAEGRDVRIALRGPVVARVSEGEGAAHELSGAEVTTWSERFVGGATRIEITMEATEAESGLPVQSGVVRAAAVSAELEQSSAVESDPAPESARTPALGESVPESVAEAPVEPEAEVPPTAEPAALIAEVPTVDDSAPVVEESPGAPPLDDAVDGVTLIPTEATSDIDEFEQLFGATVHTAPTLVDVPPPPPFPVIADGDHDGATISAAELRALRQQPAGNEAPTQVIPVAHAGAGRIRVSTGQVVELDRTVIIGRRPRSTRASGENLPHLVAVESPQQDISRSHLEVRPDADTVVVIDLHTTNGSTLLRPGADPVRLHPGEQTLVLSGDVVDLGDGVTVAFEDLP